MATNPLRSTNFWLVSANENGTVYQYHWREFYNKPNQKTQRDNWCGDQGVKSNTSNARIQEMRINDIIVSYQVGEGIVGFARLASEGYRYRDRYWTFDLKPAPIVRFSTVLPFSDMRQLPYARQDIEFVRMLKGTVFRITQRGFENITNALLYLNPKQQDKVQAFLG
jgi:hypothetical protein